VPSRPMPVASINTSLVSLPLAPAFIRSAPPMVPGMPNKNSMPPILAEAAVSATRLSSAAVPALTTSPSRGSHPNARGDNRITTPGKPPSRTIKLEPTPTTIDRQLLRQVLQKVSKIVFIRWREQHLRRTADAKTRSARRATGSPTAARAGPGIAALRSGVMSMKVMRYLEIRHGRACPGHPRLAEFQHGRWIRLYSDQSCERHPLRGG